MWKLPQEWRLVLSLLPVPAAICDVNRVFLWCNTRFADLFGYDVTELIGESAALISAEQSTEEMKKLLSDMRRRDEHHAGPFDKRYVHRSGRNIECRFYLTLLTERNLYVATVQDVTAEKDLERKLKDSEVLYRTVVESLPNTAIILLDDELRYVLVNGENLLNIIGRTREQMVGQLFKDIASDENREKFEVIYRSVLKGSTHDANAHYRGRHYKVHAQPLSIGGKPFVLSFSYDVTEQVTTGMRDELTGLYNRRGILDIGEYEVKASARNKEALAVVFIDLDGLKKINDRLGHKAGDDALRAFSEVLRHTFRDADILGRLGGDEFVAIIPNCCNNTSPPITRLHSHVAAFNRSPRSQFFKLSISVGLAQHKAGETIGETIKRADAVMYEEKRTRRA